MYIRLKNRASSRNLPCLDRETFVDFASSSVTLESLFKAWVDSGFERRLAPTVDRIIGGKGYVIDNIQFLSFSENVIKGNKENPREPNGPNKKRIKLSKGEEEKIFASGKEACDFLRLSRSMVCTAVKKNRLLRGWAVTYV